jgi:MFS family permease
MLTGAYFLAFALFQIPLGLLLDRYGPRRVDAGLLVVAAAGAALFAFSSNLTLLITARALMGLGFCGGLMCSMMAFVLWYPRSSMATLSGWMLAVGAIGAVIATTPVEMALRTIDWRTLFAILSACILITSLLILACVPERASTAKYSGLRDQLHGLARIARDPWFWRIGLLAAITQAAGLALLGLWAGPWLRDIAGLARADVAQHLLVGALAFGGGAIFFGTLSDWLARRGVAPSRTYLVGCTAATALLVPLTLGVAAQPMLIWSAFTACAAAGTLAYPLLTRSHPIEMTGRVLTAVNVLTMTCAFGFQLGVGAVIGLWPATKDRYDPAGYGAAFGLIFVLQCGALLWAVRSPQAARECGK